MARQGIATIRNRIHSSFRGSQGRQKLLELTVTIEPDPEPNAIDVCDEFLIALEQDPDAMERWEELTPGKQRSLAHHVSSAKREETRIKRALDLAMKLRTRTLHGD